MTCKSLILSLLILVIPPGILSGQAIHRPEETCEHAIKGFMASPSQQTLAELSKEKAATSCWKQIELSNDRIDRLDHWVQGGNQWAADYLAQHLKQLGGGNLEDALVALGQFGDHDMERLLALAHEGVISATELTDALIMLPLSLSDDAKAQLKYLEKRKGKIVRVARKDLQRERANALKEINKFEVEIKKHMD
jgi:hypothetical protein